jgi:hypothetical protein
MNEHEIQYHLQFRQKDYQIEAEQERLIHRAIRVIKQRRRKVKQARQTI